MHKGWISPILCTMQYLESRPWYLPHVLNQFTMYTCKTNTQFFVPVYSLYGHYATEWCLCKKQSINVKRKSCFISCADVYKKLFCILHLHCKLDICKAHDSSSSSPQHVLLKLLQCKYERLQLPYTMKLQ